MMGLLPQPQKSLRLATVPLALDSGGTLSNCRDVEGYMGENSPSRVPLRRHDWWPLLDLQLPLGHLLPLKEHQCSMEGYLPNRVHLYFSAGWVLGG